LQRLTQLNFAIVAVEYISNPCNSVGLHTFAAQQLTTITLFT